MKKKKNYLDFIPEHHPDLQWRFKEHGRVELIVPNKGISNHIAQLLFGKPKTSYIKLDEYGSFLWQQIDGKRDVYALSELMRKHFGDKAEPVIERLVQFMRTLQINHYIQYKKSQ